MLAVLLLLALAPARAADRAFLDEGALAFQRGGRAVAEISKAELMAKVKAQTRTFFDPRYGKAKSYLCLPIREVMRLAYGAGWKAPPYTEAVLTAKDGYASVSSAAKLDEEGGCLAVADAEVPGWEPVGRKRADPGPFYLSWTGEAQSTENEYPWPYQLASINLVRFEDRYPEVVARGAKEGSAERRGYMTFRGQCLRCHSINQQGGKIGPDLNAPRSVVGYRDKKTLLEFIRKPSSFRYTEMPDHEHLRPEDLEDLYAYLSLKSRQPEKR